MSNADRPKCAFSYGGLFEHTRCERVATRRLKYLFREALVCGIHAKPYKNSFGAIIELLPQKHPSNE